MNDIVAKADKALRHDLCDHCLGRLFAQVETGRTDEERGRDMRIAVTLERSARSEELPEHRSCWVCEDVFDQLPRFAEAIVQKLEGLEYNTFLIGTRVDPAIQDREEQLWAEFGGEKAEPIKAELNREIGKIVEGMLHKVVNFKQPEVVALIDTRFANVELTIAPLFIYGRYHKHSREIPQTRWPCRVCRGKGCPRCGNTGKMYQVSVQEIVGDPIRQAADGKDHFFHGMGREDIDARMLGNGRPFVIEISEPRKRTLDLKAMEATINAQSNGMADVCCLRPSTREEVRQIKAATPNKVYRACIKIDGKVNKEKVNEVIQSLTVVRITQQTPARVAHRRADLARERAVLDLKIEDLNDETLVLVLMTEAGTYVKEFVNGDNGRTVPSLAGALGVPCVVTALDVIEVVDNTNEG
jgi:tRNA pseudouridine synthase 10